MLINDSQPQLELLDGSWNEGQGQFGVFFSLIATNSLNALLELLDGMGISWNEGLGQFSVFFSFL
jgi:hypothetical protein